MPARIIADSGLLRGTTRFTGDLTAPGLTHLVFVRSPHASARILSVDVGPALAVEGVRAAFVAADLPVLPVWEIALIPEELGQPPLAVDVVRYVGERVVAVVADSVAAALDGADRVVVDYELAPRVVGIGEALAPRAPRVFPDRDDNVCLMWRPQHGGATPTDERARPPQAPPARGPDRGGESLARVVLRHHIPRLSVSPMEGHAILAVPGGDGRLTVFASTQVPGATRIQLARSLQMDLADVRVVAPAVGGGFGGKAAGGVCDHVVVAAAARRLDRPVAFVEDRHANLVGMQGRGVDATVELTATPAGHLRSVRAEIACDAGAYPTVGAVEPGKTALMACGPYRIAAAETTARAVLTNLPPVGAYRGPGRSEAALMLERTLDVLAIELGADPVALRRANLLRPDELPHLTPTGLEYDPGNYPAVLDRLVAVAGYEALRDEQARRRAGVHRDGARLMGIGVAVVLDSTAWFARVEGAAVGIAADGAVVVRAGSAPAGQRHERAYRNIVRSVLPVPDSHIRVVEGDTDAWDRSDGSMGSRTSQTAGSALLRATEALVAQLRTLAADALEADPQDIAFFADHVGFGVRGVPASCRSLAALVADAAEPVEASCVHEVPGPSYPCAGHLSVVEVDTETGVVVPRRHVAVTDCGRLLDPPSARGQVVGAAVQGIAQALYEEASFDEDGNPRAASFAEYGIPSAAEVPPIEAHFLETPSPRNPLGARGVGEIGMVCAPAAVLNAVVDALTPFAVRHLDMPCTPERVWRAMHHAP